MGIDIIYPTAEFSWLIVAAFLAFIIQPGVAMVESGLSRSKNAADMMIRVYTNFGIIIILFWFLGFSVLFGRDITGLFGIPDIGASALTQGHVSRFDAVLFQTMLCAAAIASFFGALAERTKFSVFCLCSVCMSLVIYPIVGHWVWGTGGWLAALGFHDFAGGAVLHVLSGTVAFIGCKMVGPRIGKYNLDGIVNAIRGHNLAVSIQGLFLLWLGWLGVACGSFVLRHAEVSLGFVLQNLQLAVAASIVTTLLVTWGRYGKPDVSMIINGGIAGIAAVSSGCDVISPAGAVCIGVLTGIVIVFSIEFVDKKMRADDPTGAISTHGICGALGCVLTGVFSLQNGLAAGSSVLIMTQIMGIVSIVVCVAVLCAVMFYGIDKVTGLRVSQVEELAGLDFWEHGLAEVYSQGAPVLDPLADTALPDDRVPTLQGMKLGRKSEENSAVSVEEAVMVEHRPAQLKAGHKLTQITIITSELRFEALKNALEKIGITGMTVTRVLGFGIQKGHVDMYRGAQVKSRLLPKVKVELIVSAISPQVIVNVAKKILYTGRYGDGKVFIYDVENVVKIRTSEEGYDALQDYTI